jgi:hypothetical protein
MGAKSKKKSVLTLEETVMGQKYIHCCGIHCINAFPAIP